MTRKTESMSLENALELLGFLLECKEGETAAYLTANEEAFQDAVKVAAACIEKQLQIQRIINNAMRQCMILLHEE